MGQNRFVQIGAMVLALVVLLVLLKSCKSDGVVEEAPVTVGGGESLSEAALAGLGIEGDTEKDTVATLIGQVKSLNEQTDQLRQENAALRDDNAQLLDMEQTIGRRVEGRLDEASERSVARMDAQVTRMENRIRAAEDRLGGLSNNRGAYNNALPGTDPSGTVWVQPLGRTPGAPPEGESGGLLASLEKTGSRIGVSRLPGIAGRDEVDPPIPYYTLPRNATLVNSTAMTALVGRVPFAGQVTDPYSFKVIIGRDNLAANGIEVPEMAYAVASGKAIGDWTLGCVRGDLYSLTFVFEDGTIRTVPEAPDIFAGTANQREIKIGELSDRFGNPCVAGQRISNAVQYLSQRIGVVSVQAAAEAAAASQTTQLTSVGGGGAGVATIVDGATGEYILGRSIADSADEVASWLDERQSQQFDAIYVAPGADVSMHITEQVNIDYDPLGRKTNHAALAAGGYRDLP